MGQVQRTLYMEELWRLKFKGLHLGYRRGANSRTKETGREHLLSPIGRVGDGLYGLVIYNTCTMPQKCQAGSEVKTQELESGLILLIPNHNTPNHPLHQRLPQSTTSRLLLLVLNLFPSSDAFKLCLATTYLS